ncbi:MAG: AtpZ/AtpI family protein [Rhizobiales bacterium]|nr:AtpZ/AtpI family protein [Hyphomicrobiales bacterium]
MTLLSDSGSQGSGDGKKRSAGDEAALSERLRSLGSRLDKVAEEQKREAAAAPASGGMQGMGLAFRVAAEFASGVLVGAGLGWIVDHFLGTSPWGLIVLLLLGFCAGVLNVLRAVGRISQPEERLRGRSKGDGT